jgi:mannose-1-phosphate guanylyltransferase
MKIVFFAGGVGSRLWPLSRKNSPKQFERMIDNKSSLELAVDRVHPIADPEDIFVSTGIRYREIIAKQKLNIPQQNFIFEPEMRDVGPAVGLVAAILDKIAPTEPFFILWSDHLVKNEELFQRVLTAAAGMLERDNNKIIFIAQESRFPSTNLGWMEQGAKVDEINGLEVFKFKSFYYRPPQEKAVEFHASHNHYWNPGYFGTTAQFLFSLYEKFAPEMHKKLVKIRDTWGTEKFEKTATEIYPTLEKESFDNIILEKIGADDAFVIGAELGWSDIGAWEALKDALSETEEENVTKGTVSLSDSMDSLAFNYVNDQLVVGIDLDKMLVINTKDVLLVCPKDSVPKIKKFVESLKGTEHEHLT